MGWAVAIPAIASVIGGLLAKKGADKANAGNARAFYATEAARRQSLAQLDPAHISQLSQFLFPGLMPLQTTKGREGRPFAGGVRSGIVPPGRTPRLLAAGGPLAAGEEAVVGEQGPELFVPEVDGEIVPNPGTSVPAQGTPPGPSGGGGADQGLQALAEALMPYILESFMTMFPSGDDAGLAPGGMMGGLATGEIPMPRAAGGQVRQGQPYAVGGQGPESFVPTANPLPAVGQPRDNRLSQTSVQPFQPAPGTSIGGMVTGRLSDKLTNPGKLGTEPYERGQEQSNIGLNAAIQGILGNLTGAGVDPNSPMGQALVGSAAATAGNQRNELARDFSLAKEALSRQDVSEGTTDYLRMLETILGLARSQAQAAGGQGFPATNTMNSYTPYAGYLGQLGNDLAKYLNQSKTPANAATTPAAAPAPATGTYRTPGS